MFEQVAEAADHACITYNKELECHLEEWKQIREDEGHGHQFEWLQDDDFVEWIDEIQGPKCTQWEVLYEYDLRAANQLMLGSILEYLKNDLWNISHLSDCSDVADRTVSSKMPDVKCSKNQSVGKLHSKTFQMDEQPDMDAK
ncbi:hypothetical protein L7F22_029160 [Adiantum nelumboides]|nr:hypothetical protein [Adiantum nelumboides]